jgi:hypothetical protein
MNLFTRIRVVPHPFPGRLQQPHHAAAVGALGRRHHLAGQPRADLRERSAVALEQLAPPSRRLALLREARGVGQHPPQVVELPLQPRLLGPQALRLVVLLSATAHAKVAAAGIADQVLVPPHQGGRHRPGRNDERLGLEGAKQERQREGDDDRLDRLPAVDERVFDDVARPRTAEGGVGGHDLSVRRTHAGLVGFHSRGGASGQPSSQ